MNRIYEPSVVDQCDCGVLLVRGNRCPECDPDLITLRELDEILADATGVPVEEFREQAEDPDSD